MGDKLVIDLLNPDLLIKVNSLNVVTNPLFFDRNMAPTSDGLLSNEIFGITSTERRNNFAYINLEEYFIHPLYYSTWCKIDSQVRDCVHGTKKFIINTQGYLEENENGKNGTKFLKDNIKDIKFKSTGAVKRDEKIAFLTYKKDKAFMKELIVLPALYRDVQSTGGKTGVGEINTFYLQVLIGVKAIQESKDYGFSLSGANRGRVQELILSIYDYFGSGTVLQGSTVGAILPGKLGQIRRSGIAKTTDRACRVVMSAPELKVEKMDDLMSDLTHCSAPLAVICVNFYPYMMFHIRRFFDNEFGGDYTYRAIDHTNNDKLTLVHVKDPQIAFSDERITKEIDRFVHGYSNRLIPVEIPTVEKFKGKMYMRFKGYNTSYEEYKKMLDNDTLDQLPMINRDLTWCDIFYMAANQFIQDKTVLITRYPIDSYYNQFPQMIRVSSTEKTEPIIINGQFMKYYPKIRQSDISSNTSNTFVDTMRVSNLHLGPMRGDYDGDQISSKGVYMVEANEELVEYMHSKAFYINLGGKIVRSPSLDALQSLYQLTKILPGSNLTEKVR